MIAIVTAATKNYLHAWPQCLRGIAAAASHHEQAHFIFCTDESKEGEAAADLAKRELPEGWKITVIRHPFKDDEKNYKADAQLRIAVLQGSGFAFARKIRADRCLSVESDNIIPANALRVLEWTLDMPTADGRPYYDIAAATYPNGLFLGGFGTPQHQIAEDFLPEERKLKPRLKLCLEKCEERLKNPAVTKKQAEKEQKRMGRLRGLVKKSPPDGNIWDITAKYGWRRRGWMDFAYPGIGLGAVVPSDWCGLGCTLMSRAALQVADFLGYEGKGTQDLFLCWHRWHPASLRIACVPHVVCDHIKRDKETIIHHRAYHEAEGECRGHLRTRQQKFVPV
jgi:hypothetical protein